MLCTLDFILFESSYLLKVIRFPSSAIPTHTNKSGTVSLFWHKYKPDERWWYNRKVLDSDGLFFEVRSGAFSWNNTKYSHHTTTDLSLSRRNNKNRNDQAPFLFVLHFFFPKLFFLSSGTSQFLAYILCVLCARRLLMNANVWKRLTVYLHQTRPPHTTSIIISISFFFFHYFFRRSRPYTLCHLLYSFSQYDTEYANDIVCIRIKLSSIFYVLREPDDAGRVREKARRHLRDRKAISYILIQCWLAILGNGINAIWLRERW